MNFINYTYIHLCEMVTKISFITTQSIIIKKNSEQLCCNDDRIKQNSSIQFYNKNEEQECEWGWFIELDDINVKT